MATGRLGNTQLVASTLTSVYAVTAGYYSVFNVSITNTGTSSTTFSIALSTATVAGNVLASEYIESGTTLIGNGVFERTGLVCGANMNVWVTTPGSAINVTVYGIETSTS
jgi:hypothetical protein